MTKKIKDIWPALLIAVLTPLIGALLILLKNGMTFSQISIPCSLWNDELFYYKQIEAMLQFGIPQGYFGFNESTSLYGHFAAWSPVILMPFYLVGKLFTWNTVTPVAFNLFLWAAAFVVFVFVAKPSIKLQVAVSVGWIVFASNLRYLFSVTPESMITALLFMFSVFLYAFIKSERRGYLIAADTFFVILVLMRGYYAAFGLIILWFFFKKKNYRALIVQAAVVFLSAAVYGLILHFFTAAYFTTLVNTAWVTNPVLLIKTLAHGAIDTLAYMSKIILASSDRGAWYAVFVVGVIYFIIKAIYRKNSLYLMVAISELVILSAMYLMYNVNEGARQVMAIAAIGIMFILFEQGELLFSILLPLAVAYITWMSSDTFYQQLPKADEAQLEVIESGEATIREAIPFEAEPWDNTVLVTTSIYANDMYAIPAGLGINLCDDAYIEEHFDNLRGKYMATMVGEPINQFMEEKGCEVYVSYGQTKIYKLR